MGSQALCYVAFCLLGAGSTSAEIYQTPPFRLAGAGQDVTLQCAQNLRYNAMYWYRQDPGQGLMLIYYSTVEKDVQSGDIPEGYNVSREEKGLFPLTVKLAHINQTALYLCSGAAPQQGMTTIKLCTNLLQPPAPPSRAQTCCSPRPRPAVHKPAAARGPAQPCTNLLQPAAPPSRAQTCCSPRPRPAVHKPAAARDPRCGLYFKYFPKYPKFFVKYSGGWTQRPHLYLCS